jgi:hypothetical protein
MRFEMKITSKETLTYDVHLTLTDEELTQLHHFILQAIFNSNDSLEVVNQLENALYELL